MRNFGRGTWGLPSFGRAEYGGVKLPAWWEAPPKIGGCSRCARPAGTLAAEKYVLAGGAGQNMILSFSAGCGRRNSARRALPGESVGRKGIGYPIGGFPTPKAFPSGGRCPSAHTGSDEGAIWYPTFPCRKEGATSCRLNEVFLLPRWASRSPPHPSPSVTASPRGEAFAGGTPPQRNAFSPKPCSRKMRIQIRARRWAPK